jgi:hypothetical protein
MAGCLRALGNPAGKFLMRPAARRPMVAGVAVVMLWANPPR